MQKSIPFVFIASIMLVFVATGCKKKCPEPTTPGTTEKTIYLVKFEVVFTGGSGQNKIEYDHNDGYWMTEFNQPNTWSYTLARQTGDTVGLTATSFDGTSSYARILLNDHPEVFSYTNTGGLPFVAHTELILP